jgi:hypothetical protein
MVHIYIVYISWLHRAKWSRGNTVVLCWISTHLILNQDSDGSMRFCLQADLPFPIRQSSCRLTQNSHYTESIVKCPTEEAFWLRFIWSSTVLLLVAIWKHLLMVLVQQFNAYFS